MEIWLDTAEIEEVVAANRFGFFYGVTTNPALMARVREEPDHVINKLLEVQDGPVAVQVTAGSAAEMIQQATALHTVSERIIVKVPVTQEGLIAMKELVQEEISVMATVVFHPNQALMAALTGVDYVAPYVARMADKGIDAMAALQTMLLMFKNYGLQTNVLAASLRTPDQITECAAMGVQAVTLKSALFSQFTADEPATIESLKVFAEEWDARTVRRK